MKKTLFKRSVMKLMMRITVFAIAVACVPMAVNAAEEFPDRTTFWEGPYNLFIRPETNIAYPDTGATYWTAQITIPEGATLELVGDYAFARYISVNSYDMTLGTPTDALVDVDIDPDPGSDNPFLPGAKRDGNNNRQFTVNVLNELPPADPASRLPNTLYAKAGDEGSLALCWRVYAPDKNRGITGGVALPEPRVTLADGTVLDTVASYDALSIVPGVVPALTMPLQQYTALREGYVLQSYGWPYPIPETFPAQNPPVFQKVFNIPESTGSRYVTQFLGMSDPAPEYQVGQYANLDNQYMSVGVNRGHGELVVIRGKAPVTPATYERVEVMQENYDVRYWSVATNESAATTRVADSAYDEQIPLDSEGYYTIVVSLPEDRPWNAYEKYGVKWLAWPENGDGAGHPDDALLIFRNMVASPDFEHAIQNVEFPGTEADVLGPYMPVSRYMSVEKFEALGKRPFSDSYFNNPLTRGTRYCEIFLFKLDPYGAGLIGDLWGTQALNDCPCESWDALDAEAIKEETMSVMVRMNGPRHWLPNSITSGTPVESRITRMFGDIEMAFYAQIPIDSGQTSAVYREQVINRVTTYTFDAGEEIYELTSPEGQVYVMQAFSLEVDPTLTIEQLAGLAERLNLPEGWSYNARTLATDLVMVRNGEAAIVQDDLLNTYQRKELSDN